MNRGRNICCKKLLSAACLAAVPVVLVIGCGTEEKGDDIKNSTSTTEQLEISKYEEIRYPRDLASYVYESLECELGGPIPKPRDFFMVEDLLNDQKIDEKGLDALTYSVFPSEEDLKRLDEFDVTIRADKMDIKSRLIVVDTTPPVITALKEQVYHKGETIQYKKGVEVYDNSGEIIVYSVDAQDVNPNMAGEYEVKYEASDSSGNVGSAISKITILDEDVVDQNDVDILASQLLNEIITEDMGDIDKARAIFDWCYGSIRTTADANKTDVIHGAYDGLYYRAGDCYTVYATAKYLLDLCKIDNISVSKKENNNATHYWSLVKVEGGWYHFDPSKHDSRWMCFLQTDEQVKNYAKTYASSDDYYDFDESNIPARATKTIVTSD